MHFYILLGLEWFFIKGIRRGDITARSQALAFSFFLAIFPSLIFLFTLIPYVPIDNFQSQLLGLIQSLLPKDAYMATRETIIDIISIKRSGVLSLGFFFALYFSTNGFNAMINSFNKTYHGADLRPAWRQRMVAILLTLLVAVMVITAIVLLVGHEYVIKFIYKHKFVNRHFYRLIIEFGKWIIVMALSFFAIACLYYFGPYHKKKFKFLSAGATFATLLIIATSLLFNYYVANFANYNKLYGSIGTLIIVMIYIQFNSMVLLLGFEFNASVDNAKKKHHHKLQQHFESDGEEN
ncbi:MAG: YihY/virulence factor BrkB family protein [Ferruginibacter sp.]|nr:YihY/virulence factor BrkB family protein [Ferruginibacter sp.]